MRRQTMITLILLSVLIAVAAVVQLTMEGPETPFEGPTSPGQLPSPTAQASP